MMDRYLKNYWQIAFQWNTLSSISGYYTVYQAIEMLMEVCMQVPYSSLLYKKANYLLDMIIENAA